MTKKGFQLDQVLNFRKEVEKMRKIDFAQAKHELDGATAQLTKEEQAMKQLAEEFSARQQEGISAIDLQLYSNFSRRKRNEILEQRQEVIELERKVTERRETLLSAAKDKKVLEAFREKKIRAWKKEMAEKERLFLDEISIQGNAKR